MVETKKTGTSMMDTQANHEKKTNKERRDGRLIMVSRLIFGLGGALLLVNLALHATMILNGLGTTELSIVILIAGATIANSMVGLLILSRYPTHTVGWLLLFLGIALSLTALSNLLSGMAEYGLVDPANPIAAIFSWIGNWVWFVMVVILIIFIPLYFPDGRLLSRRWRIVALAGLIGTAAGIISAAIAPDFMESASVGGELLTPAAILASLLNRYIVTPLTTIVFVSAIISVILRYRRSGHLQRAQMKWVFFTILLGIFISVSLDSVPSQFPLVQAFANTYNYQIFLLFPIALPVAVGIAIMRYRLYDIDVFIRRTLVYSLLTMALLLVYFGSVVLLQRLFTSATGQQTPLAIVISTLLIAGLFNPVRTSIQTTIDRHFFRKKYDAQQVLAQFAQTARDETDMDRLTAELVQVVQETMQPEAVSIWLKR